MVERAHCLYGRLNSFVRAGVIPIAIFLIILTEILS